MKVWAFIAGLLLLGSISAQTQEQISPSKATDKTQPVAPVPSKIDPGKEANIRHLMELSDSKTIVAQTMESMSKDIKPLLTNALPPGDYRDKLVELFFAKFQAKANAQQLLDMIVPVYDKYLSDEEIKGLIKFYETPLGKKALKTLPQIMAESGEKGRTWGEDLGRQSMIEVLAEHPDLAKALEDAKKGQ